MKVGGDEEVGGNRAEVREGDEKGGLGGVCVCVCV